MKPLSDLESEIFGKVYNDSPLIRISRLENTIFPQLPSATDRLLEERIRRLQSVVFPKSVPNSKPARGNSKSSEWTEDKEPENKRPDRSSGSDVLFNTFTDQAKRAWSSKKFEEATKLLESALGQASAWTACDERRIVTIKRLIMLYNRTNQRDKATQMSELLNSTPKEAMPLATVSFDALNTSLSFADSLVRRGQYQEAEKIYLQARLPSNDLTAANLEAVIAERLARLYIKMQRTQQAEMILDRALKSSEYELSIDPGSRTNQMAMAGVLSGMAAVYRSEDKLIEAESVARKGLQLAEQGGSRYSFRRYILLNDLGLIHVALNKPSEAIKDFKLAIAIVEAKSAKLPKSTLATLFQNYAKALREMSRNAEAESFEKKAKEILAKDDE